MPPTTDTDGAMFEALRARLTAISCRILGSQAEAEDIVQDCFFKWHRADQGALAAPAAWLTTVVQHQSIDRLRKRVRDDGAARIAMELAPATPPVSPEDELTRRAELGEALARMLTRLSPSERLALVLHDVFECGHADIAAVLGTRPANARQHLARARRRLRQDHEASPEQAQCRELVRRFQAAINGRDVAAIVTLLAGEQPVSVLNAPPARMRSRACANDACYVLALAA